MLGGLCRMSAQSGLCKDLPRTVCTCTWSTLSAFLLPFFVTCPAQQVLDVVKGLCNMGDKQLKAISHILAPAHLEGVSIAAKLPRSNQGRKRQENLVAKLLRTELSSSEIAKLAVSANHDVGMTRQVLSAEMYAGCEVLIFLHYALHHVIYHVSHYVVCPTNMPISCDNQFVLAICAHDPGTHHGQPISLTLLYYLGCRRQ